MGKPVTGEPTHIDDKNVERPGSQPQDSIVTPASMAETDQVWSDHYSDAQKQNMYSAQNPQISEPYSPLESLITDAFERFGNMSADTLDGNIKRIMLRYANKIIDDIRIHPYSSTPRLDYYTSQQETRPVPDEIMISGLTYHYAKWQDSAKSRLLYPEYIQTMNQLLYQHKYGSGKIQMNTVDKDKQAIK